MPNIIAMLFEQFWWLIPLLTLGSILKTPWFKGLLGEWLVKVSAKYLLDNDVYHAIHNVTLETSDGTTQIDHIFVSRYGIFVVETKNYKGWIFGSEHQAMWTQKIFKVTNKFQNPLRQNYKHLKALEATFNVPLDTLHSVIVFVGDSTFKTDMPANVTHTGGYIRYIKSFTPQVFTNSEVENLKSAIQMGRLKPSMKTNRDHVAHLNEKHGSEQKHTCHKCGSTMVLRKVKSGAKAGNQFWGCSQFPKCRFIKHIP